MTTVHPLEGLRVLDLSQGIAGPGCGMLCALWGADVIKVEPPTGDWIRGLGTSRGQLSSSAIPYNTGKRSIAVDLKRKAGVEAVLDLARNVDVVLESFRPGVLDRLGLGFSAIKAINSDVLFASVSGFGQQGPYVDRPCSDTVAQAFSGLMSVNAGRDGIPHKIDTTIIDAITSLYAFQSVSMHAMASRQGDDAARGIHLDLSLAGSAAAVQAPKIVDWSMVGGPGSALNAPAGSYRTQDGWIAITLVKEGHFASMMQALDLEPLIEDERYQSFASRAENIETLRDSIEKRLQQSPTAHWLEHLTARDVLCNAIYDYGDWLNDAQVVDQAFAPPTTVGNDFEVPLPRIPGAPESFDAHVPLVGEHSREILAEAGFAKKTVDALISDGTIVVT